MYCTTQFDYVLLPEFLFTDSSCQNCDEDASQSTVEYVHFHFLIK